MTSRPPLIMRRHQSIVRDLAFLHLFHAPAGRILDAVRDPRRASAMRVDDAFIFDCFGGDAVPPWTRKTSVSVSLHPIEDRTPVLREIDEACADIRESVSIMTGAVPHDDSTAGFWKSWNEKHGHEWERDRGSVSTEIRVRKATGHRVEYRVGGEWTLDRPEWSLREWAEAHGAAFSGPA